MAPIEDHDPLLPDLGAFAREEETREAELLDSRWERLAHGEMDAGELALLTAEAEKSEEGRLRYESFRPLGEAFHSRVARAILTEQAPPAPRRHRGLWRYGWRAAVAAAVLAGAVLLGPRLLAPSFPAYELAILPEGEATERSLDPEPAEGPALFHPGTAFEVAVRPLAPIDDLHGKLEVTCILQEGEQVRPWPSCAARSEIAPSQAVRIAGTVGEDLSLEPGTWSLWIVLGRQGELPDLVGHPERLRGSSVAKRSWIALKVPKPLRMEPLP